MPTPNQPDSRLRDVISASGCTFDALAKEVRRIAVENGEVLQTNKSAISYWANGAREPSGRMGQYLAEARSRRLACTVTPTEIGLRGQAETPTATANTTNRVVLL